MPTPDQDKTIIDGCVKGRSGAWEKFVDRFSGLVMWSIKMRLERAGSSFTDEDCEDIHQEVFLSLYKNNKLNQLRSGQKITAWLSIISGNTAINYIRRVKGRVSGKSVSLFEETGPGLSVADTLKADEPSIDERLDKKTREETLAGIIECLSPKEKLILNLYFVYENTIMEIAQILAMPQGTVASIITRAKEKIKERFKEKGIL